MTLLRCEGLEVRFGNLTALEGVRLEVNTGELVGLVGPNGAGKSVLLDCLCGLFAPHRGHVFLDDEEITRAPAFWRVWHGLGRTFQDGRDFASMTVRDSVAAAACQRGGGFLSDGLSLPWAAVARDRSLGRAREALQLVGAADCWEARVGELGAADRRRVQIARALAARPKALLLDEPAAGLEPGELDLAALLVTLRDEMELGILLVEHDPALVFALSDFVYALDGGRILSAGRPADIRVDPEVRRSYLGAAG